MSAPHLIRLRGLWQFVPLARTVLRPDGSTEPEAGPLPPPGTMRLPADWGSVLGESFFGRVRFTRRFGCPTGLSPDHRVELVVMRVDALAVVTLNGHKLGDIPAGGEAARFDVTSLLDGRNELAMEVELPRVPDGQPPLPRPGREQLPGGLIGEVRLEIHEPEPPPGA